MCTRYPIINRVSELKVHIELTRFVQPEKIEIDANERAVNEKSPYCFFVCTTFDSFLNDLSGCIFDTAGVKSAFALLSTKVTKPLPCPAPVTSTEKGRAIEKNHFRNAGPRLPQP